MFGLNEPMSRSRELNVCRWEGDCWTIAFAGRTVHLKDSKGLRQLAVLLRQPGRAVSATALRAVAAGTGPRRAESVDPARAHERARLAVTNAIRGAIARLLVAHPPLGCHLEATIRCGALCRYVPDPRHSIVWRD